MPTIFDSLLNLGGTVNDTRAALEASNPKMESFIKINEELFASIEAGETITLEQRERAHRIFIDLASHHDALAAHFEEYAIKLREAAASIRP
jgi:hypothetical protein